MRARSRRVVLSGVCGECLTIGCLKSWTSLVLACGPSSRRLSLPDPGCMHSVQGAVLSSDCRAGRNRDGAGPVGLWSASALSESVCEVVQRYRLRAVAHAKPAGARIALVGAGQNIARPPVPKEHIAPVLPIHNSYAHLVFAVAGGAVNI